MFSTSYITDAERSDRYVLCVSIEHLDGYVEAMA